MDILQILKDHWHEILFALLFAILVGIIQKWGEKYLDNYRKKRIAKEIANLSKITDEAKEISLNQNNIIILNTELINLQNKKEFSYLRIHIYLILFFMFFIWSSITDPITIAFMIFLLIILITQVYWYYKFVRRIYNKLKLFEKVKYFINLSSDLKSVFPGKWKFDIERENSTFFFPSEIIEIKSGRTYYSDNIEKFHLKDIMIDPSGVVWFTKVNLDGEKHSEEKLKINGDKCIEGKDTLGNKVKYTKI